MKKIKHHHLSGRSVFRMMVFLFCFLSGFTLIAQESSLLSPAGFEHQLKINPELILPSKSSSFQQQAPSEFILSENGIWLPEFARENPAGHAPLCRMEVRLENQMTVPVWIRAGEFDALPQFGSGNLYVRMKLLRF